MFGLGRVSRETRNKFLQFLGALFGFFVLFLLLTGYKLARPVPEVVVTEVHVDFAEVHVADIGADFIKKIPVVRNYYNGIFKVHQKVL